MEQNRLYYAFCLRIKAQMNHPKQYLAIMCSKYININSWLHFYLKFENRLTWAKHVFHFLISHKCTFTCYEEQGLKLDQSEQKVVQAVLLVPNSSEEKMHAEDWKVATAAYHLAVYWKLSSNHPLVFGIWLMILKSQFPCVAAKTKTKLLAKQQIWHWI